MRKKKKNILPCPCCRSKKIEYKEESAVRCWIRCVKCGIELKGKYLKSVIKKWNRRIREEAKLDKVYIEGNKGGDFLKITKIKDNLLRIESAHCCLYNFNHEMPVEVLTSLLSDIHISFNNENELLKKLDWRKEYGYDLLRQIRKINMFEDKTQVISKKVNRWEIMDI